MIVLKHVRIFTSVYVFHVITVRSRFATLSDMMRDEPDNSGSDEEGQAYYAGGADHGRYVSYINSIMVLLIRPTNPNFKFSHLRATQQF